MKRVLSGWILFGSVALFCLSGFGANTAAAGTAEAEIEQKVLTATGTKLQVQLIDNEAWAYLSNGQPLAKVSFLDEAQIAPVLISEVQGFQLLSSRLYKRVREVASADNSDIIFDNGVGLSIGVRGYFSVWSQLPGISGAKWDVLPDGRSYWLKTVLTVDGILSGPASFDSAGGNKIVVARVATTIWQVSAGIQTKLGTAAGLVRLGTVKVEGKFEENVGGDARIDIEALGVSWAQATPLTENISAYTQQNITVGMRVLEANSGVFRAVLGTESRLGLLIGSRFFILGKLSWETDNSTASHATYGLEGGWKVSELLTVRAGGGYTRKLGNTPYDHMYIVPQGWNFNLGLHARF